MVLYECFETADYYDAKTGK
jgi:hypothetical protein